MFSLFKNKKKRQVPEWVNFFNIQQYNDFIKLVEWYFENKSFKNIQEEGVIIVDGIHYGLYNLAKRCEQENQKDWKELVKYHFDGIIEGQKFNQELQKRITDFDYVKQYLAVKVYPSDYLENGNLKDESINEDIAESLTKALVFDFPTTIQTIKNEEIKVWGKSEAELYQIGVENLRDKYPIEIVHQDMGDFKIWMLASDDTFVSSILLDNDRLSKYLGTKGALVGVPNRNIIIIYPIKNLEVIQVVNTMAKIVDGESKREGMISDKLYWYFEEKMITIPYKIGEENITISPTSEFIDMLNGLEKPEE